MVKICLRRGSWLGVCCERLEEQRRKWPCGGSCEGGLLWVLRFVAMGGGMRCWLEKEKKMGKTVWRELLFGGGCGRKRLMWVWSAKGEGELWFPYQGKGGGFKKMRGQGGGCPRFGFEREGAIPCSRLPR